MIFLPTSLNDLIIITPEYNIDKRGYFARVFCETELKAQHIAFKIVQINTSLTKQKGTIRGMHFQKAPYEEAKIVQCIQGAIFDTVIDIRPTSSTYGKVFSIELSSKNKKMLYIPKGFAHGFQTLSNNCILEYYMSEFYSQEHARGIRWNDSLFSISWPIAYPSLSDKDKNWPDFQK